MTDTERTVYWQTIVLTPTGVTPGTYSHVTLTIGADGRIDSIAADTSFLDSNYVADIPARDALSGTSRAGRLVTVADSGNTYKGLYVFDGVAFDPIGNDPTNSVRYAKYLIAHAASNNLGVPLQTNAIIRKVQVQVLVPYGGGTGITIRGQSGTVFMSAADNDSTTTGTYEVDLANVTALGAPDAQLQAIVTGGAVAGAANIIVEYFLPV